MRKQGAKHSRLAVKPLGIKQNNYELSTRAALLAVDSGTCNDQHLTDLYALAELCDRLNSGEENHIKAHCDSVKKLTIAIHGQDYYCAGLAATSLRASTGILIDWYYKQNNHKIAKTILGLAGMPTARTQDGDDSLMRPNAEITCADKRSG